MPPLIVWAFGAIGAAVVARWLVRQARRGNAGLDGQESGAADTLEREGVPTLKRDPVTGIYHPK